MHTSRTIVQKYAKLTTGLFVNRLLFFFFFSSSVLQNGSRKIHMTHKNSGRKHKSAVRDYYAQFEENVVQAIIDTRVREYEAREAAIRAGVRERMLSL